MRASRLAGAIISGFSLLIFGCGTQAGAPSPSVSPSPSDGETLAVVQVTTLTTVQASSGLFLSPSAQQDLPSYVARGDASTPVEPMDGLDRAKVDLAVLFQDASGSAASEVAADLRATGGGEWSAIEHYFPEVESTASGAHWPIELAGAEAGETTGISSEWGGWRAFGGLSVRAPGAATGAASAAVATLDFEVRGAPSPLILSTDGTTLTVSNRSERSIEQALLIYSHPGGVGVTRVSALGPGASRITTLGPKERPPEELLELARQQLRDFFAASVGDELGAAMADAKSIPFLETQGLRLISLLDESAAPTDLDFSAPIASQKHVVVSHSEILKIEEEAHIVAVVADESLQPTQVAAELGRFSEGKLEYAAVNGDAAISARATSLLEQLRQP